MKRLFVILFLALFLSCRKDAVDLTVPNGALYQITANGKVHASYEYADGLLARENQFGTCETPYSITQYNYKSGRLNLAESSTKGLYSSHSAALCDPNGKYTNSVKSSFEYDALGRLIKVIYSKTYIEYEYKENEVIQRFLENGQPPFRIHHLKYDIHGNLIEEKTPDPVNGGVTRYEYDNHQNPLSVNNGIFSPSAFKSGNNVIKAFDSSGNQLWHRKFTYNSDGLPSECDEGNGAVYVYHYR